VQNVRVASYLNDPKDAVTISAEFAQLPDGANHVAARPPSRIAFTVPCVKQRQPDLGSNVTLSKCLHHQLTELGRCNGYY
jgi:hypothetical protein